VRSIPIPGGIVLRDDLAHLAESYTAAVAPEQLQRLARSLGLSVTSLCHLEIGWSAEHQAWSFPMKDARGNVRGIRLRRPNGFKFAVKGSKAGLHLPAISADTDVSLMVCEGPTDTAALMDMGFTSVVGRYSCLGDLSLMVELVKGRRPPEVVIVADADEPGRRGANALAAELLAYATAVRVIEPPEGIKDARAWLQAGGRRVDVERVIAATPVRRLKIRSLVKG
jgi:hypothetical protein